MICLTCNGPAYVCLHFACMYASVRECIYACTCAYMIRICNMNVSVYTSCQSTLITRRVMHPIIPTTPISA